MSAPRNAHAGSPHAGSPPRPADHQLTANDGALADDIHRLETAGLVELYVADDGQARVRLADAAPQRSTPMTTHDIDGDVELGTALVHVFDRGPEPDWHARGRPDLYGPWRRYEAQLRHNDACVFSESGTTPEEAARRLFTMDASRDALRALFPAVDKELAR